MLIRHPNSARGNDLYETPEWPRLRCCARTIPRTSSTPSSLLVDTSKAKKLRHGMQEGLMLITDFVLSKKVNARDLFGERLKKFEIREHVASGKDDERSRCLTDGSQFLAVFLTEDGFVDFLTAYGADAPRKILHAICEAFGAEIFSEHELQFWDLWKAATAATSGICRHDQADPSSAPGRRDLRPAVLEPAVHGHRRFLCRRHAGRSLHRRRQDRR